MNKKTKYAMYGGAIIAIANGIYNAIKQSNQKSCDPNYQFSWAELFGAIFKGGVIGASGGFIIGAVTDYYNSKEKPINTDASLFLFVEGIRLDKTDPKFVRLDERADFLCQLLHKQFKNDLSEAPFRLGSTERGTALRENFDIDICLTFNADSFASTEEMYFTLEEVLRGYVGTGAITRIRRQTKTIGVFIDHNNEEYKIDVLPKKLTKSKNHKTSGYLYVNDESLFGRPTYTKTNVKALNTIKLTETQKKIIVVFKDWKKRNDIPISSHLLQCLVLDAYSCNRNAIPRSFSKKLVMVAEHIAKHIETATIRSIENTNNILTDISAADKTIIKNACKKIVEDYIYQPNSIIDSFGIN